MRRIILLIAFLLVAYDTFALDIASMNVDCETCIEEHSPERNQILIDEFRKYDVIGVQELSYASDLDRDLRRELVQTGQYSVCEVVIGAWNKITTPLFIKTGVEHECLSIVSLTPSYSCARATIMGELLVNCHLAWNQETIDDQLQTVINMDAQYIIGDLNLGFVNDGSTDTLRANGYRYLFESIVDVIATKDKPLTETEWGSGYGGTHGIISAKATSSDVSAVMVVINNYIFND